LVGLLGYFIKAFGMAKGCASVLLIFLIVITLPVWIGIAGGLVGIVGGLLGAVLGVVVAIVGVIVGIIGSLFAAAGKTLAWTFGGVFYPVINISPFLVLLIILVVILITRSRNKTVK
jgi:hypothetical protein